jgi:hypothetical protein
MRAGKRREEEPDDQIMEPVEINAGQWYLRHDG